MASKTQRKAAIRAAQQRAARRRVYMIAGIVTLAVVIIGTGVYLFLSAQQLPIVHAQISTSKGMIQVELYRSKAPRTVENFVSLANSHFYDNLVWHRIVPGFVIQTGDPKTRGAINSTRDTWGTGGSQQTIPQELDPSLHNDAGYLGMARGGDVDSASSQFYINLVDNRSLDTINGGYAVFGRVTSGMEVVSLIASVSTITNAPENSPFINQPAEPSSVMVNSITIVQG